MTWRKLRCASTYIATHRFLSGIIELASARGQLQHQTLPKLHKRGGKKSTHTAIGTICAYRSGFNRNQNSITLRNIQIIANYGESDLCTNLNKTPIKLGDWRKSNKVDTTFAWFMPFPHKANVRINQRDRLVTIGA
jgi:hypothetical protein